MLTLVIELHFSACGKFLHYLLCSFSAEDAGCTCSVSLSTFEFSTDTGGVESLRRTLPVQQLTYRFCDSADALFSPLVLSAWSPNHLVVALPKLYCDTKLVRFTLLDDVSNDGSSGEPAPACQTLKVPVFFPASTPYRKPQLLFHESSKSHTQKKSADDDLLILALDFEEKDVVGKSSVSPLPPIVMQWSISKVDGWRAWDTELDERSEELKSNRCTWKMLRGSFVDSEQEFQVPIRSGLDWTRKAFLSCS